MMTATPTKKWTLTVRRCQKNLGYDNLCNGPCTVEYDEAKLKAHLTCKKCGYHNIVILWTFRDYRACVDCGFIRRVTVSKSPYTPGPAEIKQAERWEQRCAACQTSRAALHHLHAYQRLTAKAKSQHEQQRKRQSKLTHRG